MSVATPVIERNTFVQQPAEREAAAGTVDADALHNSRMKNNLARLLNPKNNLQDVVASIDAEGTQVIRTTPVEEEPEMPRSAHDVLYGARPATKATVTRGIVSANPPVSQPVYMVQNARADADIFRADNPINRQVYATTPAEAFAAAKAIAAANPAPVRPAAPAVDEESEDLRPTATTIQYQTIGADGAVIINNTTGVRQEGEIVRPEENEEKVSKFSLSKRDKAIIGVVVGLILAVFVLIIVNSAVISNLNNDISMLEGMAQTARVTYLGAMEQFNDLTSYDNVLSVATEQGWIN